MQTVLGFASFWLIARTGGPQMFGLYQTVRSIISLALAATVLGLGVSIPRIWMDYNEAEHPTVIGAALVLTSISTVSTGLILQFFIFQEIRDALSAITLTAILLSNTWLAVMIAIMRAQGQAFQIARLSSVSLGVVPILACVMLPSLNHFFLVASALQIGIVTTYLHFNWHLRTLIRLGPKSIYHDLVSNGFRRIPGDVASIGLLSFPTVLVSHWFTPSDAGKVGLSLSLAYVGASFTSSWTTLRLPQTALLVRQGEYDVLRKSTYKLLKSTMLFSLVFTMLVACGFSSTLPWLFGPQFDSAVSTIRAGGMFIPPLLVGAAMRNVLDGLGKKALSARATLIGLTLLVVGMWLAHDMSTSFWLQIICIALAFAGYAATMSILCFTSIRKLEKTYVAP